MTPRDERDLKRLDLAWDGASLAGRLKFIDECIVSDVGGKVVRGEMTADEARTVVERFRAAAVGPRMNLAYDRG
jgi:hypothetical protein